MSPGRLFAVFRRVRGLVPLVDPASRVPLFVRFRLEEEEKEEEEEEDQEVGFLFSCFSTCLFDPLFTASRLTARCLGAA